VTSTRRQALGALGLAATASFARAAWAGAKPRTPRIDVHMHVDPSGIDRLLALMDRWDIAGGVNLSGMHPGPPRGLLEMQLEAARRTNGRLVVFMTPDFRLVMQRPKDYGRAMADQLARGHELGAKGLKITKGLGLGYPTSDGNHLLKVDDAGLDPMFERAGELGMPVAIHTGDPIAFWKKPDPKNERWDELQAHPEWAFYGEAPNGEPWPTWQSLYDAFERRVARHPKTTFIGVHFGNAPEQPDRVARMLDKHKNLMIDTAARVPEIGRQPPEKMRAFFDKYADRVLFGTDTGVGPTQADMMYGSNGATPPTEVDEARFYTQSYRYFETRDRKLASPTPIQGRWTIDGVGLGEGVLRKIYFENAARLLGWKPPALAAR
jgi:predicted TIM-barrel fold metal-dependent hydrolase